MRSTYVDVYEVRVEQNLNLGKPANKSNFTLKSFMIVHMAVYVLACYMPTTSPD